MRELVSAGGWEVRSEPERIVEALIVPWDVVGETNSGPEVFRRGAFEGTDPAAVVLRQDHTDPPAGRGFELVDDDEGARMSFRVARTPRGDELLTNLREGIHRNVSIGFEDVDGGNAVERIGGRAVRVQSRVNLREASTTWRPVFEGTSILAVRSTTEEPVMTAEPVTNETIAPASAPVPIAPAAPMPDVDRLMSRIDQLEERHRQSLTTVPAGSTTTRPVALHKGHWASIALRAMDGERIPELELRAAADIITGDNLGVVPKNYRDELIGTIDKSRPFLDSTKNVPAGTAGMSQVFPKITARPPTGVQATEKAELVSGESAITTVEFGAVTVGGYGDLSMQLIKRSSPEFLNTWLDLLAESYAINTDDLAVDALLAAGVIAGGVLDPAAPTFGTAFLNAAAVSRSASLRPNRIWMSSNAVATFMDAVEPAGGGGRPLYPGLAPITGLTDGGPGGPEPMSLRPVWVPALDDEAVDVIVGPSNGFAWCEDGTYTLQADVPSKFGRDVGLAGIVWFMPIYPGAFTTYTLPVVIP